MNWPKFSDDFPDDCWSLSDPAFRLHVEALCWNAKKWLDCKIPRDDVRRFAKHPDAVAELVAVGWWTEQGDFYLIRHHREHQRTAEQAVAIQDRNRTNGQSGGRPRKTPKTQMGSQMASQMETQGEKEKEKEGFRGERISKKEESETVPPDPVPVQLPLDPLVPRLKAREWLRDPG